MKDIDLLLVEAALEDLADDVAPPVADSDLPEFLDYMGDDITPNQAWYYRVANPIQKRFLDDAIVPLVKDEFQPFSIDIAFADDNDYRVNTPYGILGLAANTKSKEELLDLAQYCEARAQTFLRSGDFDQSRLFAYRGEILRGLIKGSTKFSGKL